MIAYIPLTDINQLLDFFTTQSKPHNRGVFVFKHSTRCFISSSVKKRLEQEWDLPESSYPVFYVDVIKNKSTSLEIAQLYGVNHESPQLLYLTQTKCLGNASHNDVSKETVESWINE